MAEIDAWLEGFMHGSGVLVVLLLSLVLGLRHATDPDHLAAVTTLIASEKERRRTRRAMSMGLCWGLGHGTTLILVGLPLVLLGRHLPEPVQQAAEVAIGGIIVLLAARLLLRWRRGMFHAHAHEHDGEVHRHLHSHAGHRSHDHDHASPLRTPLSAYGIGLVHGVGGSGGLTLLLLSTIPERAEAAAALLLFAAGTALSMALLSTAFGLAIAGGPVGRNFERVAPALGVLGMGFGTWYALGALGVIVYPF
ncbi:hypothetical protein RxyAA322_22260 [Rubrobacter xylanophilus]|uniref:Nickel/cobalt efflux system n=1 Tax=Rubrobacter xylanophilus TaxID=49319 RepID=A0A510HK69_9ACTN|nr:hypothetical protein [Rubrobacter xylanophilus]BBL80372.1 hypothetical protein RxyAA322_22260 [Rubrobacter xylanophilus]